MKLTKLQQLIAIHGGEITFGELSEITGDSNE